MRFTDLWKPAALAGLLAGGSRLLVGGSRLLVSGALPLDLGWGRSSRSLIPLDIPIQAGRSRVFDVVAEPYLERTPRAMTAKLEVLERGTDLVLAAHHTTRPGGGVTTTVETVRFVRPDRIEFRLIRGPVPDVRETFVLVEVPEGTRLEYRGELTTDFWAVGRWWGGKVATVWEATVRASLDSIRDEAERRERVRAG